MAARTPTLSVSWSTGSSAAPILPPVCLAMILSEDRAAYAYVDCASGHVTIGRDEDCDLQVPGVGVSRTHAVVERRGDRWFIVDKSLNGTRCNGARVIRERQLDDGDRLHVGRSVIAFLCATNGPSASSDDADRTRVSDIWSTLDRGERVPFPIAVLRHLVLSCSAPIERVRALFSAIDVALRFHGAVLLASVLRQPDKGSEAMKAVRKAESAGLGWERAVFDLGDIAALQGPLGEVSWGLRRARVRGAALKDALVIADGVRQLVQGRPELDDQAHAREIPFLDEVLGEILHALRHYREYKLFSVARIVGFEEQAVRYELHEHRGACEIFPVVPAQLPDRLQNDWCYLRSKRGDGPSIALAPFVRYGLCSTCGRKELALGEEVSLGPKGAVMRVRSVATGHLDEVPLPNDPLLREMRKWSESARRTKKAGGAPYEEGAPPPALFTVPEGGASERPPRTTDDDGELARTDAFPKPQGRDPSVLFLGASPPGTPDVQPEEEARQIRQALDHAFHETEVNVRLQRETGTHAKDLQTHLNDFPSDVVHVSAHGSTAGEIYLTDERGRPIAIEPADLAATIGDMESPPKVVVLSACYSAAAVEKLKPKVGCVIAMKLQIGVESAAQFCFQFYVALASGKSVAVAFAQGKNQIANLHEGDIPDAECPELEPGTSDPATIFLFRRRHPTLSPE